eukprot:gene27955-31577_t
MFNKIGASITGSGDNCECVHRDQMAQQHSFKFLLHDETPFIYLKSVKEDHIFTDRAYISVRGESTMGQKKLTYRFDYFIHHISNVMFETAGMGVTDKDCELKFTIGGQGVSIDIRKSEQETGILYYRALTALANAQARETQQMNLFNQINSKITLSATELTAVHNQTVANAQAALNQFAPTSYAQVLQVYIK